MAKFTICRKSGVSVAFDGDQLAPDEAKKPVS
jgi:hypothetical protein